jgi:hypothetical protein
MTSMWCYKSIESSNANDKRGHQMHGVSYEAGWYSDTSCMNLSFFPQVPLQMNSLENTTSLLFATVNCQVSYFAINLICSVQDFLRACALSCLRSVRHEFWLLRKGVRKRDRKNWSNHRRTHIFKVFELSLKWIRPRFLLTIWIWIIYQQERVQNGGQGSISDDCSRGS